MLEKQSAEEQIVYAYDYDNHLTRVETSRYGATIVVEYEYDAEGNRVRKTLDGNVVINYLVDTNRDYAQVVEERDGGGNLLVRYVYGHDLISQTRPSAGSGTVTSYYQYDGLGSTRALSSSAGIVTDSYSYDAFGLLLEQTGTTDNAYRYRGEQFDEELGFYYLRARYMDPNVGRFVTMDAFSGLSRDPVSLHKYLYANANPITYSDPSGYMADLTLIGQKAADVMESTLSRLQVWAMKISPKEVVLKALYGGLRGGASSMMRGENFLDGFVKGAISGAVFGTLIKNFHLWRTVHSVYDWSTSGGSPENKLESLPPYNGTTYGILEIEGIADIPLIDGWEIPYKYFDQIRVDGMNIVTKTHVEAHAAIFMRISGMQKATLYLNQKPCLYSDPYGNPSGCEILLPRMLPKDAKLTVIAPGYKHTFEGEADSYDIPTPNVDLSELITSFIEHGWHPDGSQPPLPF